MRLTLEFGGLSRAMKIGRPENIERNDALVRDFLEAQYRVSILAEKFGMTQESVARVLERRLGPAFKGGSFTRVPTLFLLQRILAAQFGIRRTKSYLGKHGLLSGQSAEAYLLQEAGIGSRLFELLAEQTEGSLTELEAKVELAPRAARLALKRMLKHQELDYQARRLKAAIQGMPPRARDLPAMSQSKRAKATPSMAGQRSHPKAIGTRAVTVAPKTKPKRRRRTITSRATEPGWSLFGTNPSSDSPMSSCSALIIFFCLATLVLGGWYLMATQTLFPGLQMIAWGMLVIVIILWAAIS